MDHIRAHSLTNFNLTNGFSKFIILNRVIENIWVSITQSLKITKVFAFQKGFIVNEGIYPKKKGEIKIEFLNFIFELLAPLGIFFLIFNSFSFRGGTFLIIEMFSIMVNCSLFAIRTKIDLVKLFKFSSIMALIKLWYSLIMFVIFGLGGLE